MVCLRKTTIRSQCGSYLIGVSRLAFPEQLIEAVFKAVLPTALGHLAPASSIMPPATPTPIWLRSRWPSRSPSVPTLTFHPSSKPPCRASTTSHFEVSLG